MSPEDTARYQRKAAVVATAWQRVLGEAPTRHALILAMGVADFETRLGDAGGTWRGEHNWGAIHKRPVTSDEMAILLGHGVYPTGDDALRTARGLLTAGSNEALHIDKSAIGPYFAWFWAFDNDVDGAAKYLEILVRNRTPVRAILDTASPTELAAALYVTRYFEGTSKDARQNIRAYAARVEERVARIESALLGWPAASPLPVSANDAPAVESRRGGSGWWIAAVGFVGLGAFFLGRRP